MAHAGKVYPFFFRRDLLLTYELVGPLYLPEWAHLHFDGVGGSLLPGVNDLTALAKLEMLDEVTTVAESDFFPQGGHMWRLKATMNWDPDNLLYDPWMEIIEQTEGLLIKSSGARSWNDRWDFTEWGNLSTITVTDPAKLRLTGVTNSIGFVYADWSTVNSL